MKLGIQMYTLREECGKDFLGALEYVSKLGYDGVEFAGYYGLTAEELREHLDRLGLVCSSTHTCAEDIFEKTDETIAYNKTLGCKYVILPWYEYKDDTTVGKLAERFLDVRQKFADNGLVLGYHNHEMEFQKQDGTYRLDLLAEKTAGKIVLELDTYWSTQAGVDTVAYMKQHQANMPLIHLKDGDGKALAPIGEGTIGIQKILDTARDAGMEWIVVENDEPKMGGFEDAKRSIENIRNRFVF